jgi:hypothetical protein
MNEDKNIIDRETAENEFITYCDNNGIEHDEKDMNEDEIKSFNDIKKQFVKACMAGRAEVEGTSIKYTISNFSQDGFKGEVVVIKRPSGHAFTAMDDCKDNQNVRRMLAFVSAMTGRDIKYFSKIDTMDWRFFQSIALLFLAL